MSRRHICGRHTGTAHVSRSRGRSVVWLALAALLLSGLGPRPAVAQPAALNGSAYGAFVKVGLFGGPPNQVGAAPVVVLPPTGGEETETLPQLVAQFGPATIFGGQYEDPGRNPSGRLTVSTEGRTGPGGFVTSSASVVNIGPGPLIVDELSSTCRADENGVTASTTVTKGIVETSYDTETQLAATTQEIPENPPPNTAVEGTIDHVGDRFRIVFNEQVVDGDTITVSAAHMYLLGNIAVGDMIVGQSVCGLSADDGSTAPPTLAPGATVPATTLPEVAPDADPEADPDADPDAELAATSSEAGSDDGGSGLLIGALAVAAVLGVGGLIAVKRRRRPSPSPSSP